MQPRALTRLAKAALLTALVLLSAPIFIATVTIAARAQPLSGEDAIAPAAAVDSAPAKLQLEVTLNSQPTNHVIGFVEHDGRFFAARRELEEIRINAPGAGPPDELIALDRIPNLVYFYDAPAQRVDIVAGDESQIRRIIDARASDEDREAARADYGAVLNYSIYAGGTTRTDDINIPEFNGANTVLDGRLITPFGVLSQSGIVGQTINDTYDRYDTGAQRLDTTFTHVDEDDMITYRGGDIISGGPAWSRPIRMGGVQAQRNFQVRPDLVTQLLPSFSGSAAVPSTVDVYVNNARAYSKDVDAGPFQINNLPTINGAGTARVVVRDAAGRETEQDLAFYNSPQLLRPGLIDFSLETGFARNDYALKSSNYEDSPVASGSIKAGVYDDVTVEAHSEGGDGLINAGAGAIVRAGSLGIVSVAASTSTFDNRSGYQLYGSFDTKIGPVTINARSQRSYDKYEDLASITSKGTVGRVAGGFVAGGFLSIEPPKAVDSIGFSMPIDFDHSSVGVNLVHYEQNDGDTSNIITANYSRPIIDNTTFYATGFVDLEDRNSAGVYAGINMPLGDDVTLNAGVFQKDKHATASVDVTKSLDQSAGSYGYRVVDQEGGTAYRSGEVSYRAPMAKITGSIRQDQQNVRSGVAVEGAIAAIGGDIYTANHINDAFAVVDAGASGVKVLRDNNTVGETDEDGKLLVPNLNSYQRNKISIDPSNLPINSEVREIDSKITPSYRSGLYVDFQVKKNVPAALVTLVDASGAVLPVGSEAILAGSKEPYIVGYDGQTYFTELKANNTVTVKLAGGTCTATFAFSAKSNTQQALGPEVCR